MKVSISRSDAVSNTDYVKVPIFLDFFDNIPDFPRLLYVISRFYVN